MNGELKIWEQDKYYIAKYGHRTYFYNGADFDIDRKGHHRFHIATGIPIPGQVNHILFFVNKKEYMAFGFSQMPCTPCTIEEGRQILEKIWTPSEINAPDDLLSELVSLFAKDIGD